MAEAVRNLEDVPPLSGAAKSWAPGEPLDGMPSADPGGKPYDSSKAVTDKMASNVRDKIERTGKIYDEVDAAQKRILPRIEELSKNVGIEAEKMKPWDADAQTAKYRTDPIEAFGSIGSIFGIVASAWTGQPFENALNASAAAMNAIKANDDKEYNRAYKAWQDNTKMALDRHRIQHDAYQSAISLLNTNLAAANTKLQIEATRFGDKQVLAMLEAGMNKEVQDLINSRDKMALELARRMPEIEMENAKVSRLFALGYDRNNPQSEKSQEALVKFQKEQAELKRMSSPYGTGAANLTTDRQRAQDVATFRENLKTEKDENGQPKWTPEQIAEKAAEYERHLRTTASAPSGNRVDDLRSKIDQTVRVIEGAKKQLEFLHKYKGGAGLLGKIFRGEEIAENITGISTQSDRAQFRRRVLELQDIVPRILTDSNGRPLASAQAKVDAVVAGLAAGDTSANTVRAYEDLIKDMEERLAAYQRRVTGTPSFERGTVAPAAPSSEPAWKRAPLAQ